MITLFNVISSDGFIADKDGSEDFIPDELWPETLNVFKNYNVLLMGRKTYLAMQEYKSELLEPFEKLDIKKVVVTHDKNFAVKQGYDVANSPEDIVKMGENILVSSGPNLNNYFLDKKLVDKVILHQLPNSIGEGIKPFDDKYKNEFNFVSEKEIDNFKELIYNTTNTPY